MARDAEHPDTDRLVAAVLDGAADQTRDLLTTASGGESSSSCGASRWAAEAILTGCLPRCCSWRATRLGS